MASILYQISGAHFRGELSLYHMESIFGIHKYAITFVIGQSKSLGKNLKFCIWTHALR